jgi:hypothetical protein
MAFGGFVGVNFSRILDKYYLDLYLLHEKRMKDYIEFKSLK